MANDATSRKVAIFRRLFSGLPHVYGTYDPATGVVRQVKAPVTDAVLLNHLTGRQPYGVYLLVGDKTRAVVADFDHDDLDPPMRFVEAARQYGLHAYIERSKAKGYHLWLFLVETGVPAVKARRIVRHILAEIGQPHTEVFPKHDVLDTSRSFGNFINAPLWGRLVPGGRTVFMDPSNPTKPNSNQWELLGKVQPVTEVKLDEIIELNDLGRAERVPVMAPTHGSQRASDTFGLPPCAQRMLVEGVSAFQRVSCFRLAIGLKRAGLPQDLALTVLNGWAIKNSPPAGKLIIAPEEIGAQVRGAYGGDYRGYGCEDPAIAPYCDATCPIYKRRHAP